MEQFDTIDYLKSGSTRQVLAYNTLNKYNVMDLLADYTPILAGTIPIGIDTEESDLDILCCWQDKQAFINSLETSFSGMKKFRLKDYDIKDVPTIKANFFIDDFEVEIFGQNIPVKQQYGYRHMIVEHQILKQKDAAFRKEIIRLKEQGFKTEPAFAKVLGLEGDPYEALLDYKLG